MDAARLCGATRPFLDYPILLGSTLTRHLYDALIGQVRLAVGTDAWQQGYAEGAAMPLEQALALAAAELKRVTP